MKGTLWAPSFSTVTLFRQGTYISYSLPGHGIGHPHDFHRLGLGATGRSELGQKVVQYAKGASNQVADYSSCLLKWKSQLIQDDFEDDSGLTVVNFVYKLLHAKRSSECPSALRWADGLHE